MEIITYLAKVSAFWIALYACYWLLLRQHTFFRWNRFFLVASLLLSFVLPLVTYPEAAPELPVYEVTAVSYAVVAAKAQTPTLLTWANLLWALYGAGVLFMSVRLFRHFRNLRSFIKKGERIDLDDCTLVLMDDDSVGSFSFLNWVVVSRTDYEQHFDTILTHEQVHVQQRHSLDILLVEVLRVLFWFNPILILYKQSLQQVHEYLADASAALEGLTPNRDRYAEFLLAYALHTPVAALTNHFFNTSLLKSRITMLYKNRNSNWSLGKYAAVALFIGFVSLVVASCEREVVPTSTKGKEVAATKDFHVEGIVRNADRTPISGAKVLIQGGTVAATTDERGYFKMEVPSEKVLLIQAEGYSTQEIKLNPKYKNILFSVSMTPGASSEIIRSPTVGSLSENGDTLKSIVQTNSYNGQPLFTVVEQNPEFPGGIEALFKYLAENVKFPQALKDAGKEGKVFLTFTVTTEGDIRDIQVLKGLGYGADAESVRVVSGMPRWKPGMQSGRAVNVKYNLPINFQLNTDGSPKPSQSLTTHPSSYNGQPVFTIVEVQPQFPGGMKAMYNYLAENIKYPEAAARARVQGKVFLNFLVTAEGEIRDIQIVKGLGFGADQESIRVISAMPRWTPGKQDGKPINVRYNLPIDFRIDANGEKQVTIPAPAPPREIIEWVDAEKSKFQLPSGPNQPIIILDGKEIGNANPRPVFNTSEIKGIKLINEADARGIYGERGANGVIELSTKKK